MIYSIEITYRTGNSFGHETTKDTVGCVWRDIDAAKAALQRIKHHHNALEEYESCRGEFDVSSVQDEPWFVSSSDSPYGLCSAWEYRVRLPTDEGTHIDVSAFWQGYFETIYKARIVCDEDDEMEVNF